MGPSMEEGREHSETNACPIDRDGVEAADPTTSYDRFSAELHRFLIGVLGDPELAGDVMQMTFVKMLEAGDTVRPDRLKAWLFRVALNESLMIRRREGVGERVRRRIAADRDVGNPGPEAEAIRGETIDAVRRVIARLPADQRRVVQARIYEGKTFAEIAGAAGLPIGTVLTRMRLAIQRLRRELPAEE